VPEDGSDAELLTNETGANDPSAPGREVMVDRRDPDHLNLPEPSFRFDF
jgi:hypothetical protein